MFQSAPSPGRAGPHPAVNDFATPVRTPSTSYHSHPYSQALTPADASSKAVRFQNQPLPPQQQQQQQQQQPQTSALTSTATPNRSPYYNAVSTQTQSPQQRNTVASASAFNNKMALPRAAVPPTLASGSLSSPESKIALARRIKWNLGALGLLWIVPALTTKPRDAYWLVLDQIYLHVGGETDELVDGVVGWILWAISVILLFNAVEAAVLMRRSSEATQALPAASSPASTAAPTVGNKVGAVLGMHSPQVAKSINFVAASRLKGSPKTRTSNIGASSPISRSSPSQQQLQQNRASPTQASPGSATATDYSQFSPSLRRASNTVPSPGAYSSNSGGFGGSTSRMGTPTSGIEFGTAGGVGAASSTSSSSPLAAFRARHASRASSASPSSIRARSVTPSVSGTQVDLSFDDGVADDGVDGGEATFLGDESFEVDRALKSLRHSMGAVASTPAPAFR
ncbi:hypothetical protein EX895_002402 [Sporisorium graminicola]|uniref:Uncharacterized protein n=1 Tax=Sporisorium graminicola TaxID=280036 RepID=A0A4U7KVT8_9BASI|nr:hypothetical protein EX895_002402 [Sporisorium graminicola]TKY88771.1 hypothetical protein EX895_002402 [Sporisorium graminicola]